MDASTLRELQAPLKERYRSDPAAARVTLRAEGRLGEGVSLLRLTERYCVVLQTVTRGVPVEVARA